MWVSEHKINNRQQIDFMPLHAGDDKDKGEPDKAEAEVDPEEEDEDDETSVGVGNGANHFSKGNCGRTNSPGAGSEIHEN